MHLSLPKNLWQGMAPPHTETVDPQLWGGAMRCQRAHSKDFFRSLTCMHVIPCMSS